MSHISWKKYIDVRRNRSHRKIVEDALQYTTVKGSALDLGAGSLNDTLFLLKQGFLHVTAVDADVASREIADTIKSDNFVFKQETFENFIFTQNSYDFISAQYSLPFISPVSFENVFNNIISSLKTNGIFCGQLFGIRDSANKPENHITFHTPVEATGLLKNVKIIKFDEEEKDEPTALGNPRHWHLFHFIIEKL